MSRPNEEPDGRATTPAPHVSGAPTAASPAHRAGAPGEPTARTTADPPPHEQHTADPAVTRAVLVNTRPDLLDGYDTALPGARAQLLSRLLGALHREPHLGVAARHDNGATVRLTFHDGRTLTAPADAAHPFADPADGLTAVLHDPTAAGPRATNPAATGRAAAGPAAGSQTYADPVALLAALRLPGDTARLTTEVANSVANLALARAARASETTHEPTLAALTGDPDGGGRAEQLIVDGHPLHPCCRTRGGMSVADVLAYAPEHRPVLRLRRLLVPADRWYGEGPPLLLAHPWQAARLRDRHPWLTPDGETGPVRPLMSLRTVAPLDGGDHVKTAVDVQLTSAVRTVSPAAVHNGPRLSALLATLTTGLPLTVLMERAGGAVLVDGRPHRGLAHLRRAAPATAPGELAVPLAVLAQTGPLAEVVAAHAGDPYAWFTALTGLLLPPMLTVLHRGVALEAHGQNTLVVLRDGRPVRVVYRDLGGVRVSPARLRAAGIEAPEIHGDLPSDDPLVLRSKLAAALLGTLLSEQVSRLVRGHGADPGRLWAIAARRMRTVGTADARAMLREPLPVKATTAMRLAADPLADVWAQLPNPMADLG